MGRRNTSSASPETGLKLGAGRGEAVTATSVVYKNLFRPAFSQIPRGVVGNEKVDTNMQRNTLAALIAGLFSLPVLAQPIPSLDEIVVTATRVATPLRDSLSDVSVIRRAGIEVMDHAPLPALLATLPGIQVTTAGGRGDIPTLSMRGGNSGHVAILVDGLRISSATQGSTALHAIPMEAVERIEVISGPTSSLYGSDALSGVIQIFTAQGSGTPAPTVFIGAGSHGTALASAGYGGQIGDTRFNLRAGLEHSDGFSSIKEAGGGLFDMYNPDSDAYANRNADASVSHRISADLNLGARVFYSRNTKHYDATNCDTFATICTANFDNHNLQELSSAQGNLTYRVNPVWDTNLRIGQSTDLSRNWLLDPGTGIVTIDEYRTRHNQATWQNDFKLAGGLVTLIGEHLTTHIGSTKQFTVSEQTTNSISLGYQGKYGRHAFQTSGRHDRITGLGGHDSGFIGYGYQFSPDWSARASLGTAFHAPSFNDLYWPLDQINFYQGNPGLEPEKARNRELGLRYDTPAGHVGVTAFHNKVSNLIDYMPGLAPTWIGTMGNLGEATLKGVSLDYAAATGPWSWKLALDILSAKDDATGKTLQRRAPRNATVEIRRAFGRYNLGARIQATSYRYNDKANSQRLPGHAEVDLDASYTLAPAWNLEARIGNLFDQDYTLVRNTIAPYNDYAVPGRTFFIGLRWQPAK